MNDDVILGGIQAGMAGDAERLCKKTDGFVALGWHGTTDLTPLPDVCEAFKAIAHFEDRRHL